MSKEPWGILGAFFYWMIKGFKGSLNDEFNTKYNLRNFLTSILIIVIIIFIRLRK